jgi:Nickel responsive protein SCO4226-like
MKRYLIERQIPGVGNLNAQQLKEASATSNAALARLEGRAQWVESYVIDDKTYCIYLADSEEAVYEHSRLSGFPANKVTEVRGVISPMTASA